jgi:hypothetical protein
MSTKKKKKKKKKKKGEKGHIYRSGTEVKHVSGKIRY